MDHRTYFRIPGKSSSVSGLTDQHILLLYVLYFPHLLSSVTHPTTSTPPLRPLKYAPPLRPLPQKGRAKTLVGWQVTSLPFPFPLPFKTKNLNNHPYLDSIMSTSATDASYGIRAVRMERWARGIGRGQRRRGGIGGGRRGRCGG